MTTINQTFNDFFTDHATTFTRYAMQRSQQWYEKIEDFASQELVAPVSEQQLNDALKKFVVDNVDAIMDMYLEVHDGWLRLYATVNYQGIFARLAVNLRVVHVQLDRYRQRLVFGQLGNTEVLSLYSDSYVKSRAIHGAIWAFHKVLKRDPLGLILGKLKLVRQKEDILYLDIGRWLKKNKKIMNTLLKAQVNHGLLVEDQLLLKVSVNIAEVLNLGSDKQLISEADNPANAKHNKST